jgi:hypothetical protein
VLAGLVLTGAVLFMALGAILFFWKDRAGNMDLQAVGVGLGMLTLGFGSGYVGVRLLRMKKRSDSLLSHKGRRVASYLVAACGLVLTGSVLLGSDPRSLDAGLFAFAMAYWLYRSGSRTNAEDRISQV